MEQETWPTGRVGFVVLLGRPNTGKSTLLNTVLNYHLAPVSAKPQTTRRRLLGIYSTRDRQFLFLDTPGIHAGAHAIDEAMLSAIHRAVRDADVVLCLADPLRRFGDEDGLAAQVARESGKPVVVAINKSDLADTETLAKARAAWAEALPGVPQFVVCALEKRTVEPVLDAVAERLTEGPFLYGTDEITDAFERQIGIELIRETLMEQLRDEVPHSTAVEIESWSESETERRIGAVLHVERATQKAILIGAGGHQIRELRNAAQRKLETLCGVPVHLQLHVKVSENWREKQSLLREFGYGG